MIYMGNKFKLLKLPRQEGLTRTILHIALKHLILISKMIFVHIYVIKVMVYLIYVSENITKLKNNHIFQNLIILYIISKCLYRQN